jgi:DNA-binding MarR family transcriptional regulator
MTDERRWSRVLTLHVRVEQNLAKALHRRHGLGLSEYRALAQLSTAKGGELRIQELADAIGLNQSSVSRLVARMEEAGLTVRCLCPNDRRGVYSVITDQGRERLASAKPIYAEVLAAALDTAAGDPELAETVKTLRTV